MAQKVGLSLIIIAITCLLPTNFHNLRTYRLHI